MIGAIILFNIVSLIINFIMSYGLNINILHNLIIGTHPYATGVEGSLSGIAMDLSVFIILFIIFSRKKGGLIKYVKLDRTYDFKKLKFIIPAVWGSILIGGIVSVIAVKIYGTNSYVQPLFTDMFKMPFGIIQVVVIAPIVEETLVRGVVFNYLRKNYNLFVSIVLQALVFGILHGNVAQGFNAFIIGISFTLIYLYTGSLWGDITAHMLTNATVLSISLLLMNLKHHPGVIALITLLYLTLLIVSLILAIKYYKKHIKNTLFMDLSEDQDFSHINFL